MAVKTFDPRNVILNIGGAQITGFANEATFLTYASNDDLYSMKQGLNNTTRVRKIDRSATLTLTLDHTSDSNDLLWGLVAADAATNAGAVPLLLKEGGTGRTIISAESCWVQKQPDVNLGTEPGDKEWILAVAEPKEFIGGA